jgi:hypothetical protein
MLKNEQIIKRLLDLKQNFYDTLARSHLEIKDLRENSKPLMLDDSHECIKDWNRHGQALDLIKTEIAALIDGNKPWD